MTMVKKLRYPTTPDFPCWVRVVGAMVLVIFATVGRAAEAPIPSTRVHYLHQGAMPPGAIGSLRLQRGGPLHGYFQPVEIKAPEGASVSLAAEGTFIKGESTPRTVGLLVGQVYRLRVTQIPLESGVEVYPTIELVDRLFAPKGQERRFAIPIDLTVEELRLAAAGKFVTRVIYVEDPSTALPTAQEGDGVQWFDVQPGGDPLATADSLGRPVAILRLGGRLPIGDPAEEAGFCFNYPPFLQYPCNAEQLAARPKRLARRPRKNNPAGFCDDRFLLR